MTTEASAKNLKDEETKEAKAKAAKDAKVEKAKKDLESKQAALAKAVEAQSKAHDDVTNALRELVRVENEPEPEVK